MTRAALALVVAALCACARPDVALVLDVELDLVGARARGALAADEDDQRVLAELAARLEQRLTGRAAPARARVRATPSGLALELAAPELGPAVELWVTRRTSVGALELLVVCEDGALPGCDLEDERARLARWLAAHPGAALAEFDGVARTDGGPHARLVWRAVRDEGQRSSDPRAERARACLVPAPDARQRFSFDESDLGSIGLERDAAGYLALRLALADARRADLRELARAHSGAPLAVVLDGEILCAPRIAEPLEGVLLVAARQSDEEAAALADVLRSGRLRAPVRSLAPRAAGSGD